MKKMWLIPLFAISNFVCAQNDVVRFTYDNAGNQIQRILCINCLTAKKSRDSIKEVAVLQQADLQKFTPSDNLSYYPNPVKEELYLQWDLIEGTQILSITIYDINGRLLKSADDMSTSNSKNISFGNYPRGVYAVLLRYNNGEQKSIKIIKE